MSDSIHLDPNLINESIVHSIDPSIIRVVASIYREEACDEEKQEGEATLRELHKEKRS